MDGEDDWESKKKGRVGVDLLILSPVGSGVE